MHGGTKNRFPVIIRLMQAQTMPPSPTPPRPPPLAQENPLSLVMPAIGPIMVSIPQTRSIQLVRDSPATTPGWLRLTLCLGQHHPTIFQIRYEHLAGMSLCRKKATISPNESSTCLTMSMHFLVYLRTTVLHARTRLWHTPRTWVMDIEG
ncbi:hypothetical protein BD289DRAFT_428902 [Coniella lustricola]|uniref:Uncharacterized protein n=1 Tax=Coniella lustricola TaxID=2025994 RepID=A0A2T3ADC0_9PEZI|nr:hypothetical protein BD289DRAFT_428902 [Coniella lustricola]